MSVQAHLVPLSGSDRSDEGRPRVLFIDDETSRVRPWIDELTEEEGFSVEHVASARRAWKVIQERVANSFAAVVMDIMIPLDAPVLTPQETAYGTRTGVRFLEAIRELDADDEKLPVVVLTNVDDPGLQEQVEGLHALYRRKRDCGPSDLAVLLKSRIEGRGDGEQVEQG